MTNHQYGVIGFHTGLGELLRRFNAKGDSAMPVFDRRRTRMLRLCSTMILFTAVPWAAYLFLKAEFWPASLEVYLIVTAVAMLLLAKLRLLRLASLLFTLAAILSVCGLALTVDVPSPGVPRTIHLLFIPICIANVFLSQNEGRTIRYGLPILILLMFCFLGLYPSNLGLTSFADEPARQIAARVNISFTAIAVFAVLFVMLEEAKESRRFEADFARAIIEGDIQAYLQPQCLADGRIVGAEALMRWRHAERGFVAPSDFIPVAERSGLIIPAGQRVLEDVCKAMLRWQQIEALRDIAVSVNVSRVQLTPGMPVSRLVDAVPASLASRGLIKFELTESMFVDDFDATCKLLEGIRARGIRISLDDFGTGFSSLSYLRQLPLDDLKLDQSFVRQLPADRKTAKIAGLIVGLGHELEMDVIAEGVENRSQLDALLEMGCTRFQGYFFSRAVTLPDFERLVLEGARRQRPASDTNGDPSLVPA
jgi:EAL domain-containing protein (putative c-di-GMP-specific phosphodiesterase class I)